MARAVTKAATSIGRAIARLKRTLFLAALLLLTIGFAAVGLYLRPADTGPPVPDGAGGQLVDVEFDLAFDSLPPANYEIDESIVACVGYSTCGDYLGIAFWSPGKPFPGLTLTFLDSYQHNFCPLPFRMQGTDCKLREGAIPADGFEGINLNFPSGFFFKQDGAYGGGVFPVVQPTGDFYQNGFPVGKVKQELSLGDFFIPLQISMVNGPPPSPSNSASNDYIWNTTSNDGAQELSFITTNPFQLGVDSGNEFLSGIMFGVAGAALIALIVEAMRPKETDSDAGEKEHKRRARKHAIFREWQDSTITKPGNFAQNIALILITISVIRSMLRKNP